MIISKHFVIFFILYCILSVKYSSSTVQYHSDIIKQHIKIASTRYTILHRNALQKSSHTHKIPDDIKSITYPSQSSKEYLIEFRGLNPAFRYDEFIDAYHTILRMNSIIYKQPQLSDIQALQHRNLIFIEAIPDTLSEYPICAYVCLPNDEIAMEITKRCSMVRRVIEVWGDTPSVEDTSKETILRFDSIIAPVLQQNRRDSLVVDNASIIGDYFIDKDTEPFRQIEDIRINHRHDYQYSKIRNNTWWVHFERYGKGGRSGLSVEEKRNLLSQFKPLFTIINSTVDFANPDHSLIYFEDWNSYQTGFNALLADARAQSTKAMSKLDIHNIKVNYTLNYLPHSCIFGRILCSGPSIVGLFDLKNRPFIGTTSMNALCAHIAANAAKVQQDQRVLDPFCGTGSLLLAAAYLGAYVVGSDIDLDSLGKAAASLYSNQSETTISSNDLKSRSKNVRFLRKDGQNQIDKNTMDNFVHYGLRDRVLDLIGVDAMMWTSQSHSTSSTEELLPLGTISNDNIDAEERKLLRKYEKFDAIISDPPFGRREKAFHSERYSAETDKLYDTKVSNLLRIQLSQEIMLDSVDHSSMGDPLIMIEVLLKIAVDRLKSDGKLVFFLPTKAFVSADQVMALLDMLANETACSQEPTSNYQPISFQSNDQQSHTQLSGLRSDNRRRVLVLERVVPEELSNSLWRWLCVMKLIDTSTEERIESQVVLQ